MLALFATTLFLSAALLFAVEPMFARMVLPRLGGSPAVWNTAMVFYQSALLAGYGYAHALARGGRGVRVVHLALMGLGLLLLPLRLAPQLVPGSTPPVPWLLGVMAITVGLPFLLVSTTGPLVQRWFGHTGHAHARDPYFLYGASNAGSLIGLFAYPFLLEPRWSLTDQSRLWAAGYVLLLALVGACAALSWRGAPGPGGSSPAPAPVEPAPGARRRLRWVLLAFAPSSLMLGVTTHLSMDLMSMPLLWVVPLGIYLVTFIVAFGRRRPLPQVLLTRLLATLLLAAMIVTLAHATQPLALVMGLHLAILLVAGLLCHGLLAADRPGVAHLTEFYLWLAAGGALGGVFNALLAPLLFRSVTEYPIALVLALALAPAWQARGTAPADVPWRRDVLIAAMFAGVAVAALFGARLAGHAWTRPEFVLFTALLCLPLYALRTRPLRMALAVAGILLLAPLAADSDHVRSVWSVRSFFGIHRVQNVGTAHGTLRRLVHGTTVHGLQWTDAGRRAEPLSYYHRRGPAGAIFTRLAPGARSIAVAGLGTGALSAYATPGQRWTYFEIDPAVGRIASDTTLFTYLAASAAPAEIRLGDGRLLLAADTTRYDLLVLDAYSSDAIPVHLLTREAFALYLERLTADGVLALHLSNRYFELEPLVARLAADAGMVVRIRRDPTAGDEDRALGRAASTWAVAARDEARLAALAGEPGWRPARAGAGAPLWTDDFSSLVSVLKPPGERGAH